MSMMSSDNVLIMMPLLLLFVWWLLVWVFLPTNTYRYGWITTFNSALNTSTYFGEQGENLLLFSFPMMLMAALSCVYLHHTKTSKPLHSNSVRASKQSGLAWWLRRPLLVKAPLGIVTAVELCFAVMFVALLGWSFGNYLHGNFGHPSLIYITAGEKKWLTRLRSVSVRFGSIGNICLAFLFFPVTRGSSILPLFGLTSESSIKYHIWLGHLSSLLFVLHGSGFTVYWAITNQMALLIEWSNIYGSDLAGAIAVVLVIVIWLTSLKRVRRKMFEVFFYTHQLYALFVIFYVLHVGPAFFCMVLPGIFLFVIDRHLRFLQSRHRARLLSARVLPCGVVELNFAKSLGLQYNPTSIMFINVPTISRLQWHPFTVISSSNMETDKISVVIKTAGSWSQKLYQQISSSSMDNLSVSVEGPYGPSSFSFLRHESLIMVCGGSGIAPFISIIRDILFQTTKPNSHIPNILLVCSFKTSAELSTLDLLLPISGSCSEKISQIQLQIEAYVTRENERPKIEAQKPLQIICFKPDPLDSPISATLGPNNWMWLGAIIASSFLLFLVVLGLVTRYYIYPYDQIAGQFYHHSYRCLWNMLLVFASAFLVSSVAFVLSKRHNAKDDKQVKNVEMVTPGTSPVTWSYSGAETQELESLPTQSLAQAMNVHFGARPDLKRILLESEASDVGVLVCGPGTMRHEVARICSSGLAENLHFESISFNW